MGLQHTHNFHEFFVCLKPESKVSADEAVAIHYAQDLEMPTYVADVFYFPAGQPHFCRSAVYEGCPNLVLYISEEHLSSSIQGDKDALSIIKALNNYTRIGNNSLPLSLETKLEIRDILYAMEGECLSRQHGWNCALKIKFLELILTLYRNWQGKEKLTANFSDYKTNDRIRDVLNFIDGQYMNNLEVEDLMRISCMSRSHFHAVFKAEVGCTFKEHLNRVRINNALDLIHKSDLPLAQIALSCGFSSQSRFNHVFRSVTGRTPKKEKNFSYG